MSNFLKELQERDTAKEPKNIKYHKDFQERIYKITGQCPACQNELCYTMKFCDQCGQRINWKAIILKARYLNACQEQGDELQFFIEMMDKGYTLADFENALTPVQYQYAKTFMEDHGLI